MGTRRCPNCGEEYSDTYKKCPFCEEEEALRTGKPLRRRGGKRLEKRPASGGVGGIMLLMLALVIVFVVGYVAFGEQVAGLLGIRTDPDANTADTPQTQDGGEDGAKTPDDSLPTQPDGQTKPDGQEGQDSQVPVIPVGGPLALDQTEITIAAGDTARLTASGGSATVVWSSSNEHIATVDGGAVTGVAGGSVAIKAVSGEETVECKVNVTGDPYVSTENLSLNRTDFTLSTSSPTFQMEVKGNYSSVTWSIEDTSVATISEDGLVTRVGKGMTTITANVDGQVLTCIVRG